MFGVLRHLIFCHSQDFPQISSRLRGARRRPRTPSSRVPSTSAGPRVGVQKFSARKTTLRARSTVAKTVVQTRVGRQPATTPAGALPRGRGGRRGGAGTRGTSSYRIVAERARLRVLPLARSRASAEPITVSRAAASARASTCDNEHGRASPLDVSWVRRRFSPLPGRSLPFPLVAVRDPRPAPD